LKKKSKTETKTSGADSNIVSW